jgi:hypothetical protein
MESNVEQQFHPHLSEQMFLETHQKFGVLITYDKLWHLVMPNPHIK